MAIIGNVTPSRVTIDNQPVSISGNVSASSTRGFYSPVKVNTSMSLSSSSYTCPAGRIAHLNASCNATGIIMYIDYYPYGVPTSFTNQTIYVVLGPSQTIKTSGGGGNTLNLTGYTLAC